MGRRDYLICGLLVAFWAVGNIVWLALDDTPPVWDPAFHIMDAICASEAISQLDVGRLLMLQEDNTFYPPLWHVVAGILMLLLGKSVDVAIVANLLFTPAIVFGIYYTAKQLFDRRVGLFAACVGALLPGLWGISRTAYTDFALAAMVTLFVALILVPNALHRRRLCAALGLVFGFGMLTKWTFVVYVAGPFLLMVARYIVSVIRPTESPGLCRTSPKNLVICLLLFSLTAGAICLPWYVPNLANMMGYASRVDMEFMKQDPSRTALRLSKYYLQRLISDQLLLPCFLLAIVGGVLSIKKKKSMASLLSWIAVPIMFFAASHFRDHRYMTPILPAFAVLVGVTLRWLFKRRWPRVAAAVLVLLLFAQWLVVSYGVGYARGLTVELGAVQFPVWGCIAQDARPAMSISLPYDEMAAHISRGAPKRCSVFVVPVTAFVNPWTLRLETQLSGHDNLTFKHLSFHDSLNEHLNSLLSCDFVVCKDGRQGESPFDTKALMLGGLLLKRIRSRSIHASLIKRFPLPDGSSVYLLGPNRISQETVKRLKREFLSELAQLEQPERSERLICPNERSVLSRFPESIQWSPVQEALWYIVHLSGATPAREMRVCGEQLTVPQMEADLMPPGKYTITVAAANPKGRSGWSKVEFGVEYF